MSRTDEGTPSTTAGELDAMLSEDGAREDPSDQGVRGGVVRTLAAVLVNVGVLTALLVYFGWVRSERMSTLLGIDEAIFGMTVEEYVRRSITSVVYLPIYAAVAALAWVAFDQWLRRRRKTKGDDDRAIVFVERRLWLGAVILFLVGVALWFVGYAATFIVAPLVCAAAVLLFLYALSLRSHLPGTVDFAPLTEGVLRGAVAILVAIGLFWSATNWAVVEGTELARSFPDRVQSLPGIEVDSDDPLDIVAPGVVTSCVTEGRDTRYHYRGLRLLESTGGNYFLISDGWTPEYGIVVMLPATGEGTRFTFVRDVYGDSRDDEYPPCDEG